MIQRRAKVQARASYISEAHSFTAEARIGQCRSMRSVIIERVSKDRCHNLSSPIFEDFENPLKVINFIQAFHVTRFDSISEVDNFVHIL